MLAVANEQGDNKEEWMGSTDRMSDSVVNSALFGVGG
jgi:hypothetical protein